MAMTLSYANLYRKCVGRAKTKNIHQIPSYGWFLLQFWPSTKTAANVFQYTGQFKVKRMLQARILHKNNPDEHYVNAIVKFLKEKFQNSKKPVAFVSADAKCRVSKGEPGFLVALVSSGKKVLVSANETAMVADHDFSKISIIQDAVFIYDIPEPNNCEQQISLNDMDNESEDEEAVITVNPTKKFNFFIY